MIKRIITGIIVGTVLMFVGRSMPKAYLITPEGTGYPSDDPSFVDYTFQVDSSVFTNNMSDFEILATDSTGTYTLIGFAVPEDTHNLINNTICLYSNGSTKSLCVNLNDYNDYLQLSSNTKWGINISPNNVINLYVTSGNLPRFNRSGNVVYLNVNENTLYLRATFYYSSIVHTLYMVAPDNNWNTENIVNNSLNWVDTAFYSNTTWYYNNNNDSTVGSHIVDWNFSFETIPEFKTTFSTVDTSKYNNNVVSDVQFTIQYEPSDLERFVAEFGFVEGDPLQMDEEDYSYDNLGYFTDPINAITTYPVNNNGVVCMQIKKTNDGRVVYKECWDIDSIGKPLIFNDKPDKTKNTLSTFINDLDYGGPISSIMLLPPRFIESIYTSFNGTCSPINLSLLNKNITFNCISLNSFLGNNLTNVLDIIFSGMVCFGICRFLYDKYDKFTNLENVDTFYNNSPKGGY